MLCTHLKELVQLCEEHQLKLSSAELIHVVCTKCGKQEVCPAMLTEEYDARVEPKPPRATTP